MTNKVVEFDHRRLAERYVAGERMSHDERAWFEHHLKDCEYCADEVALARLFHRSARPRRGNGVSDFLAALFTWHK
jgi:hypothetical protein